MRRDLPQSHGHEENSHLILDIRLTVEVEGIKALHLTVCCLEFFVTCFDGEFGAYIVVIDQEGPIKCCRAVSVYEIELPEYAAAELSLEEVVWDVRVGVEAKLYAETAAESYYVPDGRA